MKPRGQGLPVLMGFGGSEQSPLWSELCATPTSAPGGAPPGGPGLRGTGQSAVHTHPGWLGLVFQPRVPLVGHTVRPAESGPGDSVQVLAPKRECGAQLVKLAHWGHRSALETAELGVSPQSEAPSDGKPRGLSR